jgi:predicted transcriptional regulator
MQMQHTEPYAPNYVPLIAAGDPSAISSALDKIKATWKPVDPETALPPKQPLAKVTVAPPAYQSRGYRFADKQGVVDQAHALALTAILEADPTAELDPVLVLPNGAGKFVVVEGHHRRAAYRRAGRSHIPVSYFLGTPEEAVTESGKDNRKLRKPADSDNATQRCYELIVDDFAHPERKQRANREIAEQSGRAEQTVKNMRSMMRKRLDRGFPLPPTYNELKGKLSAEEIEEQVKGDVARIAKAYEKAGFKPIRSIHDADKHAQGMIQGMSAEAAALVAEALVEHLAMTQNLIDLDETIMEHEERHAEELAAAVDKAVAMTGQRNRLIGKAWGKGRWN